MSVQRRWRGRRVVAGAVAGLTAHAKGVRLGIYEPTAEDARERRQRLAAGDELHVSLMGRAVPAVATPDGIRAIEKGKPANPAAVEKYLASKFGDRLGEVRAAMERLAASVPPAELARVAFRLYERFGIMPFIGARLTSTPATATTVGDARRCVYCCTAASRPPPSERFRHRAALGCGGRRGDGRQGGR